MLKEEVNKFEAPDFNIYYTVECLLSEKGFRKKG
jgi:hypothetical protein